MNSLASMNRNRLVYECMTIQAVAHRRMAADRQEAAVLAEVAELAEHVPGAVGMQLRKQAAWTLAYDQRENADHDEQRQAAKAVCRIIEFPAQNETAVNVISINSGGDEAA